MKTPCPVIQDLIPLYADGICSEESRRMVEAHLAECEDCRRLAASGEKPIETGFEPSLDPLKKIRKANTRKTVRAAVTVFLVIVLAMAAWSASMHVCSIVDTVWSDDGTKAFVVYDRAIGMNDVQGSHFTLKEYGDLSGSRGASFALHWLKSRSRSTGIFQGIYEDGFWSPDGSKFVINAGSPGYDLYLLDLVRSSGPNIDFILNGAIANEINSHPERFGYAVPGEADADLTFLQWSEDSGAMLIYYRITDDAGEARSGYCWYDYEENTVSGFMTAG